jgi:hypothetical protein
MQRKRALFVHPEFRREPAEIGLYFVYPESRREPAKIL